MAKEPSIRITSEFGLVVRLEALKERGVDWAELLAALEVNEPLDRNEDLASFGPHFGQEALDVMLRRLAAIGLEYFEYFFEFSGDYQKWCRFRGVLEWIPKVRHGN